MNKRKELLTPIIKNLLLEHEYNKKKKIIKESFMKYKKYIESLADSYKK